MSYDDLISRLAKLRQVKPRNGFVRAHRAECPVCEGHSLPLSIAEGSGGIVVYCFGGCAAEQIVASLGLSLADLFPTPLPRPGHGCRGTGSLSAWITASAAADALSSFMYEAVIAIVAGREHEALELVERMAEAERAFKAAARAAMAGVKS